MIPRLFVVRAIAWRDYAAYFNNPTGYVFITVFVLLGALAAFWQDDFYVNNLANLDPLNEWYRVLVLFIVPAITMGLWAEERKQGTDELLLTLPAKDLEIVLGKYLAASGIYLTGVLFSFLFVVVLLFLGRPDLGLMLSTYLGYAFLGLALVPMGMVGSLLSSSMTVAFILGTLICGVFLFFGDVATSVGIRVDQALLTTPLRELSSGVLSLNMIVSLVIVVGTMLYINLLQLGARRKSLEAVHALLRVASVAVSVVSLTILVARFPFRVDVTEERLTSLSRETRQILSELDRSNPVYVRAYVSPKVPREYVPVRTTLLSLLREYEARSGGALVVDLREIKPSTREARQAEEEYGIKPVGVFSTEGGAPTTQPVFLGAVFSRGADEVVVPFLHKGIPLEYELTRSVRVVSRAKRKRVGVLDTDAKIFGGFDFQSMNSSPAWSIVEELKKQYEVTQVSPDADYPADLDAFVAILPSSLTQEQLDRFSKYVEQGKPTLILDDPAPMFNLQLAPSQPKGGNRGMFGGGGPPPQPKGDIQAAYERIGIQWQKNQIVWDRYNPHPKMQQMKQGAMEIVFVTPFSRSSQPFHPTDQATSGLQEVVHIFGGTVKSLGKEGITFTPLLRTTSDAGVLSEDQIFQRSFLGVGFRPNRPHFPRNEEYVLAARVEGKTTEPKKDPQEPTAERTVKTIFVADTDMISEQIFEIRKMGEKDLDFDNVGFVLNLIDLLAGDSSFVDLRKRRSKHRTLTRMEKAVAKYDEVLARKGKEAEDRAETKLREAQDRFNRAVQDVRDRKDLDEQQKEILVRERQELENRRLEVERKSIEEEKTREIEEGHDDLQGQIEEVRWIVKGFSLVTVLPPLLLGILVFAIRSRRERSVA